MTLTQKDFAVLADFKFEAHIPILKGEINYFTTGLGFGMRRRRLFPEGLQFVSIPFDHLPSMLQTLREMPWVPAPFKPDGLEYVKQLRTKLGLE